MIEKREFGSTGHQSTVTLFGGASLSEVTQEEANETLEVLLDYGVNHIDTAASYGDSELRIGPWMEEYRDQFFLATKTEGRTYEEAKKEIRSSLERLRVDQVDLLQLHNLIQPDEWETVFGGNGALEAAVEAKEEGLVRFLGVTGHSLRAPKMHRKSLEEYDFDSVLLPFNFTMMQNGQYAEDFEELVELCEARGVAIQTIKSLSRRRWREGEQDRATWYKPLEDQEYIDRAVSWVTGRSEFFLNTVGDIELLPKVLDAADRFSARPSEEEMEEMVSEKGMKALWPE
ncbi:aldo/keto reductase [Candidatus Bipolaricaulota bacterium]|nr:aldo/keto reductase [Candidatus Bipolaricaulota bacterium]